MKVKKIFLALLISVTLSTGISYSSEPKVSPGMTTESIECDHYWTIEYIGDGLYLVERDCNDKIISVIPLEEWVPKSESLSISNLLFPGDSV